MTKFCIFDTETSGLFDFSKPAHADGQPRLAHLGMIRTDEEGKQTGALDLFVKPDGWEMTEEATNMNGLTTEYLHDVGLPIGDVLDAYVAIIEDGYALAAYNAQYDTKVMRGELRRLDRDDLFEQTPNTCLMRSAMKLGVKKPEGGRGFPKLRHCMEYFGIEMEGEHSADGDARSAFIVFQKLLEADALSEPKVHYAKNRPTE